MTNTHVFDVSTKDTIFGDCKSLRYYHCNDTDKVSTKDTIFGDCKTGITNFPKFIPKVSTKDTIFGDCKLVLAVLLLVVLIVSTKDTIFGDCKGLDSNSNRVAINLCQRRTQFLVIARPTTLPCL